MAAAGAGGAGSPGMAGIGGSGSSTGGTACPPVLTEGADCSGPPYTVCGYDPEGCLCVTPGAPCEKVDPACPAPGADIAVPDYPSPFYVCGCDGAHYFCR
jgi:hypothetical protein